MCRWAIRHLVGCRATARWDNHTKADPHIVAHIVAGTSPPEGEFVQVAGSFYSYCALRGGGLIACVDLDAWGGLSTDSLLVPPAGEFTKITAGPDHACAIRAGGAVVCWGSDGVAITREPSGP